MRNPQGKAVSAALRAGLIRTDSVHDSRREGRKPRLGVFELVAQVADSKANVLISDESGTSKEMVARAIHKGGERRDNPFVVVNCAAIPENLLEYRFPANIRELENVTERGFVLSLPGQGGANEDTATRSAA